MGTTYTEAELKDDANNLEVTVEAGNFPDMAQDRARIARLLAAALEGAKVPGLVADNAALLDALKELADLMDGVLDGSYTPDSFTLQVARRVLAQEHPGAALLAEHEREVAALQAQVRSVQTEVRLGWDAAPTKAALQARVAELERELEPKVKSTASCHHVRGSSGGACSACFERAMNRLDAARSERDALRAQVAPMREALEWIERETHPEDGLTFERIHAKAAAALSAETKGVKS